MTIEEELTIVNAELWTDRSECSNTSHKLLWHYTDWAGLCGIAQSKRLWSSDVKFMNDVGETSYGKGLCDQALERLDRTGEVARGLFERMASRSEIQVFCTSFCEDEDELSQWRAYGSNNGFSLGIELPTVMFKPDFRNIDNFAVLGILDPVLIKIDYSLERQTSLVERVFSRLLPFYDSVRGTSLIGPFFANLFRHYIDLALRLKNPAFESEKEWRIVWICKTPHAPFYSSKRDVDVEHIPRILYRPSAGGFIPHLDYIRIAAWGSNAPYKLASVVQGPRAIPEQHKVSLEGFLKQSGLLYDVAYLQKGGGFKEILVRCSKVPLRMR